MRLSPATVFVPLLTFATICYATVRLIPHLFPVTDPELPRLSQLEPYLDSTVQRSRVLGYDRNEFGPGWATDGSCRVRDNVLRTQFSPTGASCNSAGETTDVYTGGLITADEVEIDHIFPLSAAWDLGAHQWDDATRLAFANDPSNLIATTPKANREKSDQLPASWLPPHRAARCWYSRRLAYVAVTYSLPLPDEDLRVMHRHCRLGEWLDIY